MLRTVPAIGDSVVLDGDRYWLYEIDADGTCRLQLVWGEERDAVLIDRLRWDTEASVWRVDQPT